jgi:protein arginine kinase activator
MEEHFGLSDLLAGLADLGGVQEPAIKESVKCSFCGFTLVDFQRTGRLGCPKCYETFKDQLAPLLRRIHGQDRHMGKLPIRAVSGKLSKEARELHTLKIGLQKAISTEAFEEAASLRDRIKKIEGKLKSRKR